MTSHAFTNQTGVTPLASPTFGQFGGACAVLSALASFLYAIAFLVLGNDALSALCLLLVGLLASAVFSAVYERLRATGAAFALWATVLGSVGAAGTAIHGGYDLANAIHPPATPVPDLPSQIDPRGLLTFGVTGLAIAAIAWLIERGHAFPSRLGYLGYLAAFLLIVLYLARLIVLDAKNPVIVVPALLSGFLVAPAWYLWLGLALWRGGTTAPRQA
ncbi:MAG: hypothetical protein ACTHMR_22665 [Thermomicrobiales bacterium]